MKVRLLFRRRGARITPPKPPGVVQFALAGPKIAPHVLERQDEIEVPRSQIAALALDVGPHAALKVTAAERDTCLLRLSARAGGDSEEEAREGLDEIRLVREGDRFTLPWPRYLKVAKCRSDLTVLAPADLPVTVCAAYASTEVSGIQAPVDIRATHGGVKIIGTTGDVRAGAHEGRIDFSGDRGRVRLDSDQIDLRITAASFDGTLEAVALGTVRVVLPRGFVSPLEALVKNDAALVCRADIRSKIDRRQGRGGVVFSYGTGDPVLRLLSLTEAVVIDNSEHQAA